MKFLVIEKENNRQIDQVLKILEENALNDVWYGSRYLFNLWYIIIEPDYDDIIFDKNIYLEELKNNTIILYKIYKNETFFNFILGYIMSISYWYFLDIFKYPEDLSKELLRKAFLNEKDTLLKLFYYYFTFDNNETEDYENTKNNIKQNFNKIFCNKNGILEKYFWEFFKDR